MLNRRVWLLVGVCGLWGLMGCGGAQPSGGTASCPRHGQGEQPCAGGEHHEGCEHGADCPCHGGRGGEAGEAGEHAEHGEHGDCPCHGGRGGEGGEHHEGMEHHEGGEHHEGMEHHEGGEHGEHHEAGEHANLPPALAAFHAVLRPVWHSEPGPARGALACQNAAAFTQNAAAVSREAPPAGADAAAWRTGVTALTQAAGALATECGTPTRPNAEARLTTMHEAFHALTERVPGGG